MKNGKKYLIFVMFPLFLCVSCLHSKTDTATTGIPAGIKILRGNATLKIAGKINEQTVTKNETKNISAGKEYAFSVFLGEVVTINVISSDGNNVEIITYQSGREKKFTVQGTDKTGLFVVFQHKRLP
jgi:hypothetical protein